MARLSPKFVFGQYASMDAILEYLLTASHPITTSNHFCINGHAVRGVMIERTCCEFMVFSLGGQSLQEYFDNFTAPIEGAHHVTPLCLGVSSL